MQYISKTGYDQLLLDLVNAGDPNPKDTAKRLIDNKYPDGWDFENSASASANNLINSKTSTTEDFTTNVSDTSSSDISSSDTSSSIVDNTKTDSTNTINGTTTEEQEPVKETPKEGTTINLPDKEETVTETPKETNTETKEESQSETQSPSENISDNNVESDTSSIDKSKAYDDYTNILKKVLGDSRFNQIETGDLLNTDMGEVENNLKNVYGISDIAKFQGDLSKLYEIYSENGGDESVWGDNEWARGMLRSIPAIKPIFKGLYTLASKIPGGITSIANYIKAGAAAKGGGWIGALISAIISEGVAMHDIQQGRAKDVNGKGEKLPYREATGNRLMTVIDSILFNIPSMIIKSNGENPSWENTPEQQKNIKTSKKATKAFQKSKTYKGLMGLDDIAKEYGKDEANLAYNMMNYAILNLNKYGLLGDQNSDGESDQINQEAWFDNFEYDPKKHNWYMKDNGSSITQLIRDLSHIKNNNE